MFIYVFILLIFLQLDASMLHQEKIQKAWKEENLPPFDELILSWNGIRPIEGKHLFYIRVKINEWSPWLLYASWGHDQQRSFLNTVPESHVKIYQDTLEITEKKKGTAFEIQVLQEGAASLCDIRQLHVYTNSDQQHEEKMILPSIPVKLPVKGLSQIAINHHRNKDLCSPTSTTAVIRYLLNHSALEPLNFSQLVWDSGFDIYGNWVLNIAQASSELGAQWSCWVERLTGFDAIVQRLFTGTPVITSVKGPLKGGAFPYSAGHLMVVVGYDPSQQKVLCMDPAFPFHDQTHVCYDLSDFIQAWKRRGKIAYIFNKNESHTKQE